MTGARPVALSLGLILEEGLPMATLKRVVASIRAAAEQCGVAVLTGDTKVVERGKGDGVFVNTSAIGVVEHGLRIHPSAVQPGDAVLVSGDLGRHGTAILVARAELGFRSTLKSDLAPLNICVQELIAAGVELHCLRDLTRGGLASALDEIVRAAGFTVELNEDAIPFDPAVQSACELLGLDPLAMANEGRMVVFCPAAAVDEALQQLRKHHPSACQIGMVQESTKAQSRHPVHLRNRFGVLRPLEIGRGEQLPRIC
jgi:hydrogenase expression/formation protein HypE